MTINCKAISPLSLGLALACLLVGSSLAAAHPFHASIAMAEWNAESKSLEIALRVDPGDLDRALSRIHKKNVDIDSTKQVDKMIVAYLNAKFSVKNAKGQRVKLVWVGKEVSVKSCWLYFEFPKITNPEKLSFHSRLFFELEKQQINTINLKIGKKRNSLRFKRSK